MKYQNDSKTYEEYQQQQIDRSLEKWGRSEVIKEAFRRSFAEDWHRIEPKVGIPKTVGCMGIRSGAEYIEFKKHLPWSNIYGVDIAPKVVEVGTNCFALDFNHLPEDWKEKFDLVYSNSLDHSYKVEETLEEWKRVIKPQGFLFIVFCSAEQTSISNRYSFDEADIKILMKDFTQLDLWHRENLICGLFQK